VAMQHAIGAVHRHKVHRSQQIEQDLELLLRGVAGNVQAGGRPIDHLCASTEQVVDVAVDRRLVARDGLGRKQYGITLTDAHIAELAGSHARQGRVGLALRAGSDDHQLAIRQVVDLTQVDARVLRPAEVAQLLGDGTVLFHASPRKGHLAATSGSGLNHQLDA